MNLGIDVGNRSLKLVVTENNKLVEWVYLPNEGIVPTFKKALSILNQKIDLDNINRIGICGAGRNFLAALIKPQVVRTEIIALYQGILNEFPYNEFTIFEIGGEDAKILVIRDKMIKDFVLNSLCSANLGTYLESIAHRLGVKIEDFGLLALGGEPLPISSKCAVFSISSCLSLLNQGAKKEDILAGVAQSLVRNFLSMYKKPMPLPYIFCGGVALNEAIHYYLEKETKSMVFCASNPLIVSAKGIAYLASQSLPSSFNLKELITKDIKTSCFFCSGCSNNCKIIQIGEAFFGSKCGKYERSN